MPIRLDLLAEDHEAEELRRKDPVKRAIHVAVLIVILAVFFCAMKQMSLMGVRGELKSKRAHWNSLEGPYQDTIEQLKAAADVEHKLNALYSYSTNRFLWGPVLNSLQHYGVDGVYLTEIRSEQTFTFVPEKKEGSGKNQRTIPAVTKENNTIWVQARDIGNPPGEKVNEFRESIAALPYFAEALESANGVKLTSLKPPQVDPMNPASQYVEFTIQCNYPEKTHESLP